ncbi:enhancer-mRNA decapping Edc3 [Schizosaccharomyces cryophilus OY26]|uniref:Enhancer of mRNA-decapping protein 3 n=1 Tax=Schizosaccharomyces cryophilus (strain OY26 / ATCC MYA-4695 / CBS 11777 / NBRC 106824 / NRRL Y48691) TaxID=653667 RepID=S9WY05_SCHCR|nr:enhancer-mRNA decapping Edc3 [Schizosaccharomyces cryophilus OY26]EPY49612.1 enhancer-mRNA decapping Edc3 [Schizosaccharomyces cryophilus OY26]
MSVADFYGSKVEVYLNNDDVTQGVIANFDAANAMLQLRLPDNSTKNIVTSNIKNLKILPNVPGSPSTSSKKSNTKPTSSTNSGNTPSKSKSKNDSSKNQWAMDCDGEFDFAANLEKFDKKQIFAEFREKDKKDPTKLLVAHNKSHHPKNYHPNENVLDNNEKDSSSDSKNPSPSFIKDFRNNIDASLASMMINETTIKGSNSKFGPYSERPKKKDRSGQLAPTTLHTVSGEKLITVQPDLLAQAVALAIAKTSTDIVIENAAQILSQFIYSVLGGHKRFTTSNHNSQPLVCIIVGQHDHASAAVAAGRRLCAIGVKVVLRLLTPYNVDNKQLLMFLAAGGHMPTENFDQFIDNFSSPIELIVDTVSGFHSAIDKKTTSLINWINKQNVLVLSVDIPSGYTCEQSDAVVEPKWTLALGALSTTLAKAAFIDQVAGVSVFVGNLGTGVHTWDELGVADSQVNGQYLAQITCNGTE